MVQRLSFPEAIAAAPQAPGLYQIFLRSGAGLKCGIGSKLRKRLGDHKSSPDSGLKIKPAADRARLMPCDVISKRSILAKHLFFNREIAPDYDLTIEAGRRAFLTEQCWLTIEVFANLDEARKIERRHEASGRFRYVGLVKMRGY